MLWNESAHVVDPDDFRLYNWADWARLAPREGEPFIRTVTFRLRVPEVLTLTRHDRPRHNAVTFCRRNVFKRDHTTCQYCGVRPGTEELTIDHVIPRSQGGLTNWENCVLACVAVQRPQGEPDPRAGRDEAAHAPPSAPPGSPSTTPRPSGSRAGRGSSARPTGTSRSRSRPEHAGPEVIEEPARRRELHIKVRRPRAWRARRTLDRQMEH